MNLLLFKVNPLAETLLFVSVAQQLRRTFPEARLTVFTCPDAAPLYGGALAPQRLVTVERSAFNNSWRNPIAFAGHWWQARKSRARGCLLAHDQGNVAHFLATLTVTPVIVGAADLNLRLPTNLSHIVHWPPGSKVSAWNWELGRALAAALDRYDWPMKMPAPDLTHLLAPRASPRRRLHVVIDPGAHPAYRRWPLERFTELATRFSTTHDVVWIMSSVTRATPAPAGAECIASTDISAVASALSDAALFIGNHADSLQLASALGRAGVVLSGPTHREWDPSWHADRFLLLRTPDLPCLPCDQHRFTPGRCTNNSFPLACMDRWSVDEVERRCREWLARLATPSRAPFDHRPPPR